MSLLASALSIGVLAASGADVATTEIALRQGYVETGPQQRGMRLGANVAITSLTLLAAGEMDKQGHHGAAKVTKVGLILGWGACAVRNVLTMKRGR